MKIGSSFCLPTDNARLRSKYPQSVKKMSIKKTAGNTMAWVKIKPSVACGRRAEIEISAWVNLKCHGINAACVGTSPFAPKARIVVPPDDLFMYQVPFEGRKTAASVLPSPSKSPGAAMSVEIPNGNA